MKDIIRNLNSHNLPTDKFREDKKMLCLNENPYGCSDKVKEALVSCINLNEYPDDNSTSLREKIAEFYNINLDNILIGNGSGEILQILSRSILKDNNDEVITCVPTYPYYFVETVVENAKFIEVPLKQDKFDIDGIIDAVTKDTKIIYITNPNNPIGTIITEDEAYKLIQNVRKDILIVFDEAYYEYVHDKEFPNIMDRIKDNENVCILRTFSKAYGLAAMRVGYLIGSKTLISNLNKVRLTFNISKLSQIAAENAILDQEFIKGCKAKNKEQKERIYKCLQDMNISYIPSETNFIVIKDENELITRALTNKNIITKTFMYKGENHIRLSIGSKEIVDKIIEIIKNI